MEGASLFEFWPPSECDRKRLERYELYEQVYCGATVPRYKGAKLLSGLLREIGIVENYPALVCKVPSSLLFGRAPSFSVSPAPVDADPTDGKTPQITEPQARLNELLRRNKFHQTLKESAISQAKDGGALFRLRVGTPGLERGVRVIIEEVPLSNYFVEALPHNRREVIAEYIGHETRVRGQEYLLLERHTSGLVENTAWMLGPSGSKGRRAIIGQVSLAEVYPPEFAPMDAWEHGLPRTLLFYVPNFRLGSEYWGKSDLQDLLTIFDGINNRISKIDGYLDDHAEPKFVGLPGMRNPDGTAEVTGFIETDQVELAKHLPRYVTWDGQVSGSFQELDHFMQTLSRLSRIAPAFFGMDEAGSIESGIAMRMRFFSTTSLIDDKQGFYNQTLKDLLESAMLLDYGLDGQEPPKNLDIDIHWRHGLPIDASELTRIINDRLDRQTISRETAISKLDEVSREEAQRELARVNAEKLGQPTEPAQAEEIPA